ncbi:MAG: hypothetical protein Q8M16_09310 [Pirellulaceae bacterium]|nr:hypothetical protein [Pirellulaceae bacterium]
MGNWPLVPNDRHHSVGMETVASKVDMGGSLQVFALNGRADFYFPDGERISTFVSGEPFLA